MGSQSFEVNYFQVEDVGIPGEITFNGVTMPANGRLDTVGASVVAAGFSFTSAGDREFAVTVECTRTSSTTMRVTVVFEEPDSYGYGYGYGYGYPGAVIEKVIEDVPLDFN